MGKRLVINDLDERTLDFIQMRAKEHGRSAEAEAREMLQQIGRMTRDETLEVGQRWRERLTGGAFPDATDLIREDRDR